MIYIGWFTNILTKSIKECTLYKIGHALYHYCKKSLQVWKCELSYATFEPPNHVFFPSDDFKQEQNKNGKKEGPRKK
jgi:hypothetical protein